MKKWLLAFGMLSLFSAGGVFASEGTAEMFSLRGRSERCFFVSMLMTDGKYKATFSCRDLLFPPDMGVYGYAMWAVPVSGGDPVRLGTVGVGVGQFTIKDAFSSVYISEDKPMVRQGTKKIFPGALMKGDMRPIVYLERTKGATPTPTVLPTPTPEEVKSDTNTNNNGQTLQSRLGQWFTRVLGVLFAVGILVVLATVIVMSLGGRKKYPPGV